MVYQSTLYNVRKTHTTKILYSIKGKEYFLKTLMSLFTHSKFYTVHLLHDTGYGRVHRYRKPYRKCKFLRIKRFQKDQKDI